MAGDWQEGCEQEQEATNFRRYGVLDWWVNAFTVDSFLELVDRCARQRKKILVANHNVNSLSLCYRDQNFAHFYARPDYVFVDGAPVVWLSRLSGRGLAYHNRIAVLDWFWELCLLCESRGFRLVHLGSSVENIRAAERRIYSRHPNLQVTLIPGYFDMSSEVENRRIVETIRNASPDILLIGMGMPRQEKWVMSNLDSLPDCANVTVGGVLGYIGGDRPTPPRFLGFLGVEWFYRLATEPGRLWRRYLIEPIVLWRPIVTAFKRMVARERS